MFMRRSLALGPLIGAVFLATWLPAISSAAIDVQGIQLVTRHDAQRAVFQLSGPVKPILFTLQNPERVVVDLPGTRLVAASRSLPSGAGVVKEVRVASRKSGVRVVFDVARPVRPGSYARALAPRSKNSRSELVVTFAAPAMAVKNRPAPAGKSSPQKLPAGNPRTAPAPSEPLPVPIKGPANDPGDSPEGKLVPVKLAQGNGESRDIVIAIDAGHGGEDPGAIGRSGTREKDVTLAIARRLKDQIDREPGMRAFLTRSGDFFIPLRDRMRRAAAS